MQSGNASKPHRRRQRASGGGGAGEGGLAGGALGVLGRQQHARLGVDVLKSQSHATLYTVYGESRMEYAGWCQNDFNVRQRARPRGRDDQLDVRGPGAWGRFRVCN